MRCGILRSPAPLGTLFSRSTGIFIGLLTALPLSPSLSWCVTLRRHPSPGFWESTLVGSQVGPYTAAPPPSLPGISQPRQEAPRYARCLFNTLGSTSELCITALSARGWSAWKAYFWPCRATGHTQSTATSFVPQAPGENL